jgi:integrase
MHNRGLSKSTISSARNVTSGTLEFAIDDELIKTKTGKARRVDMSDQLASALRDLMKSRKEEALRAGKNEVEDVVFPTDGAHTSQNTVRNVWKRVLSKAGLRDRRIHDVRHTFASILLSAGSASHT